MLSLVAGRPVHAVSHGGETVNTCSDLDWQRSFATHLWYLNHPVASVADILDSYEEAWRQRRQPANDNDGALQAYAAKPVPAYAEKLNGNFAEGDEEDGGDRAPLDVK